jgi:hypothetical protein
MTSLVVGGAPPVGVAERSCSSSRGRSCSRSSRAAASTCTPAVVLLAVTAGGSLFGIAGAYLAVPVTAVVAAVFGSLSSDAPEPDSAA